MSRCFFCLLLSIATAVGVNPCYASPQATAVAAPQEVASAALSKEEAAAKVKQLLSDYHEKIRETRSEEWKAKKIVLGEYEMKFDYRVFGDKPAEGRSLFISMHGGGTAPGNVNENQWKNQINLYKPAEGIYLAPRAPTNKWNMWHADHIDDFFARIIENAIAIEDVNPNRVYLMGYSAGGDGVYQMAPRMADQLAAAAMMAGHPNGASPANLRNMGFTIHMGGKDSAYKRNKIAAKWKEKLAKLQKQDPQGYKHEVTIHEQHGHWMQRDDAVAVPWMEKFTRNPIPEKVVWRQSNNNDDRFFWLAVDSENQKAGAKVIVNRKGNRFEIEEATDVNQLIIRLNDEMVDFTKPIEVAQKGADGEWATQTFSNVERRGELLEKTLAGRGDVHSVFSAEVTVDILPPAEPTKSAMPTGSAKK